MGKTYALITGASSGIGYELAKIFAQNQINLILVARQRPALTQLADQLTAQFQITVVVLAKDLSVVSEVKALVNEVRQLHLNIEYLVNSAGFGDYGPITTTDWNKELMMMNLNMIALTYLTKEYAQEMVKLGRGKILNLGSTAAFLPGPFMAIYYASKAYVLRLSLAVAEELKGTGVSVTTLCPGPTASKFQFTAQLENSKIFNHQKLPTAAEVAEFGYRAMMAGKTYAIHGWKNKTIVWLLRVIPIAFQLRLVRHMQEPT